jgi:ketosteroid isomerase-like protein
MASNAPVSGKSGRAVIDASCWWWNVSEAFTLSSPIFVGIGLAVAHAAAGAHSVVIVPKWADDFLAAWYHAYNAGNAEAVSSFFEQDATLGEDRGRRAIAASLTRAFSSASYQCQGHFEAFRQVGNAAVAWGIDACVQTLKATGVSARTKERWLAVFEQQASGKWLVSRQTWEELKP